MNRVILPLVCIFLLSLEAGKPLVAQTSMGTITGLIIDRSEAVIPGASVTAKNQATGAESRTVSSSTGNYVIPNLPVGSYQISVSQSGFKSWSRSNIALSSGDTMRVDAVLEIGQVTEQVEVSAEAAALKT